MLAVLAAAASLTAAAPAAPPTGLLAAYSFDEGRGAVAVDASGHGHAGALSRAAWTTGRHGRALSFAGPRSWVTVPRSAALDPGAALTVEAWVYPTALGT